MLSRALLLFFSGIILIGNGTTQRHPRDKRYNLKVHINATQDTITLKFIKPSPDTKLEGFILGYGSSIFAKQFIALPENGEPYITEVVAEPKYLIAVQPIPPNDMKKHCTGQVNIHKPLQLIIGTVTPTSVLLSWGAMLRSPFQDNIMNECMEDGYFTIRYREKENNRKWTYQDCPTTDTVIDKLRPSTQYEFSVRPCKENNRGVWSSPVTQQTHDTSRSIQQTNNQRTTTNGRMPKGPHDKPQPYASRIILKPGFNKTYTRPISSKVNGRPSPSKPANVPSEMIQESFQTSKSKVAAWPQVAVGNAESKEHGIKKITPSMKIVPFTSSSHQEAGNSTTTSVPPVTLLYIKEDKQMEKSQHKLTYSTTQPPKIYQAHVVDLQGNPPPKPASTTPTTMIHFDKADFIRKSTSPSLVEVPPTIPSILKKKISATVLTSRDGARLWGQGYLKPNNTRQRTKPFWADKGEQYKGISKTKPPPVVAQGLGINLAGEDAVTPERTKQLDSVKNNSLELTPAVKKNSAGDNFPVTESRQQFNTYRSSSTDSTPDFTKPQTEYGPTGSERGDQLISVTNGSNKPEGTVKMQHPGEETTVSHRTISIRNNSVDLKSTIQSHYTATEGTTVSEKGSRLNFFTNIQTEADPALTNKYRVNSDKDLDPENQGTSFRNITSEPVTSVAKPAGKVSGNHKQPMANRSNSVPPRKQGSSLQNLPSANKLIPNVVEGKPGESGKKMELDIDKSFIFDKISATQKPAKEERKWITTTDAPNINASRMEPIDNSSVFTSFPVTDVDAMGKERFVAPHVKYVHKEDKVPCSITETMRHFPEEDIINQDINSPPKHPPSNLTVVTVEGCPSFVILDWEKVKNDTATEYEVISKEEGSTGKEESVLTTNQTHTAVENLKPNTSYEFRVKPVNILGEGPQSEPVTFSTESADPRVSEYVSGKDAIWTQIPFKADSYSECNGKMFVKRTWYRKFVGIQLCNSLRYKIYLSDTLTGTFYNIGDQSGQGEDHCQFVDSFLDGRTGKQYPPDQLPPRQGFYRSVRQEPVSFGEIGGRTHVSYVQWYECGTTIPGKW
ncbi:target of Nesh-SH3 isoform X7 [Erpetoichthys calabaricus]|uniref:target of Nesh-SH3 isoform X7 n=1 Tax=Erpetoichthys calabaricus TaxID=27687 RepID=UPI0022347419|nr:target of Nesh-SH3 isoform X7 [Erpetoichthys calabaricus]